MKLWKIMLAALICVLMLSAVAMAAEHTHVVQEVPNSKEFSHYTQGAGSSSGKENHTAHYTVEYRCQVDGCTYSYRVAAPQHDETAYCTYTLTSDYNATCTADGTKSGTCSVCKATYVKVDTGSKLNHDMILGPWIQATCQKAAYHVDVCSRCGYVTETLDPAGRASHDWEEGVKIGDATCLTPVQRASVCKWCKAIKDGSVTVGTIYGDHKMDWTTVVEPTCDADGLKNGVCKLCGHKETLVIAGSAGHVALPATIETVVKATCTTDGYKTATCYKCNQVYKIKIDKTGHKMKDEPFKESTCGKPGHYTYSWCENGCGLMKDYMGDVISAVPVIPANGQHILSSKDKVDIKDCTSSNNYAKGNCEVCGEYARVYIPASAHSWPAAKIENALSKYDYKAATCTDAGYGTFKCTKCEEYKEMTIPAKGHDWTNWEYLNAASCTTDLIAQRFCKNCNPNHNTGVGYETKVVEEALGHNWILEAGKDATCTEAGNGTRICTRCKTKQYNVTIPAKGHNFSKVVETVKPTCDAQGYTVFGCAACDATQKGNYTAALGHNYSWVVVTKPSEAGNGKNEYTCQVCGKVSDTKTVKYTKYYYNNTMTSFGPSTKDLVGGSDWYRVTPVDLTVDGVYTYDLVASNKYIVGKVTIAVNAGTLTVSYKANYGVDVKEESLLIYASKADLAAGSAITAPVGAAINVAETFGADTQVLVSLILTGDYDAAGKPLVDASAAASMAANID